MKKIILLLSILIISGCKKTETTSTIGDEVIGTYNDFRGLKLQVYKTGNQKYALRKLSTAPFPEFTFQFKLNLFGLFGYNVPAQGNISSDSSSASYYEAQHRFEFTIKENTGAKWVYDGFK